MTLEDKLFLVKTKKDTVSHIKVNSKMCKHCASKMCLIVCPAKTYEERKGVIEANYENCLECGSCRVICTDGAIEWENPRGGFGVTFING
ncbi:MAG: 4Fe-4S dicluster domain-containing protein [Candidatus Omnitrophica bacterium]|nr:4Fe-4S dicluster domain-containing protein [Candidatus Omnitrophota bacterium]